MRYQLLLPLLWLLSCAPATTESISDPEGQVVSSDDLLIFGYRGGWGNERYFRLQHGKWYRNAYADLSSNDPKNKLNRDALATDEGNWELIGPAPGDAKVLAKELPLSALVKINDRMDCAALAHDGGCTYLGVYREGEYMEWHGDFDNIPALATYMVRVENLINERLAE